MPASDKVGSWLGDAKGADGNESDGSDPGAAPRTNGSSGKQRADEDDEEDDDAVASEENGVKREESVDWEMVLPKVRAALEDASDKRRRTFIGRYLYVTPICK